VSELFEGLLGAQVFSSIVSARPTSSSLSATTSLKSLDRHVCCSAGVAVVLDDDPNAWDESSRSHVIHVPRFTENDVDKGSKVLDTIADFIEEIADQYLFIYFAFFLWIIANSISTDIMIEF